MPTRLNPGGKDPGVADATAGGEKQLPRRAMPNADEDELVQEELCKNMDATTNSKDTGPILARPVTDTIRSRIVEMRKNRVATRLLLAKRKTRDVKTAERTHLIPVSRDRGKKEEPGVLKLQTERGKMKPARLKPDKDAVNPQRKGDRIGRGVPECPQFSAESALPCLASFWTNKIDPTFTRSGIKNAEPGLASAFKNMEASGVHASRTRREKTSSVQDSPTDSAKDSVFARQCVNKSGPNRAKPKTGVAGPGWAGECRSMENPMHTWSATNGEKTGPAQAMPEGHEAAVGCPFCYGLELAIRSPIGQETVATAIGRAKSSVDISIVGKEKQNPSHDKPRPAVSTIESDRLKDLAKNGSSKCAKLDASSVTPIREHLMTESAVQSCGAPQWKGEFGPGDTQRKSRPARAIDRRAAVDPGCACFDTGTVESMRAQERSSGDKPVLASSRRTASTTLSKDTGDVESTLAGSDAGDADSRTARATQIPVLLHIAREQLNTERLLASREEPCDDKRPARFRTEGISPEQVLPDTGAELPPRAEDLKSKGESSFARRALCRASKAKPGRDMPVANTAESVQFDSRSEGKSPGFKRPEEVLLDGCNLEQRECSLFLREYAKLFADEARSKKTLFRTDTELGPELNFPEAGKTESVQTSIRAESEGPKVKRTGEKKSMSTVRKAGKDKLERVKLWHETGKAGFNKSRKCFPVSTIQMPACHFPAGKGFAATARRALDQQSPRQATEEQSRPQAIRDRSEQTKSKTGNGEPEQACEQADMRKRSSASADEAIFPELRSNEAEPDWMQPGANTQDAGLDELCSDKNSPSHAVSMADKTKTEPKQDIPKVRSTFARSIVGATDSPQEKLRRNVRTGPARTVLAEEGRGKEDPGLDKPGMEEEKSRQLKLCSGEDMPTVVESVVKSILPAHEKLCKNGREPGRADSTSGKEKRVKKSNKEGKKSSTPGLERPKMGKMEPERCAALEDMNAPRWEKLTTNSENTNPGCIKSSADGGKPKHAIVLAVDELSRFVLATTESKETLPSLDNPKASAKLSERDEQREGVKLPKCKESSTSSTKPGLTTL
ncbi:unnamed protein product [Symbiodinium sp. CCMP2456]|nr:unnamed protein product [Symbiodinium sp. CCMP2456]